jgi:hypothetical protein
MKFVWQKPEQGYSQTKHGDDRFTFESKLTPFVVKSTATNDAAS